MASVCYLIVCVNLLYSFETIRPEAISPSNKSIELRNKQESLLKSLNAENQEECLANMITPYWKLTYDEQLEKKQNKCRVDVDMLVNRSESLKNLMTYKLLPIVPSPVTKAYRNKDEFLIRRGVDGNPKTVGCTIGKISLGSTVSVRPTKIVTIKESHKRVAQVYEDFIRVSSVKASIKLHDGGHWNTLTVRSNEAGDVMACVTVKPNGYSNSTIQQQQQVLKDYFFKHLPNISLFHQVCPGYRCSHHVSPFNLLYGKHYLIETLNGYKFYISPDTVFPYNKLGTELLYDTIIKTAKLQPNITIFDICSGKSTTSILMSKFVREILWFEYSPASIADANNYVVLNNILNVKFLLGNITNHLISELENLNRSSDVVVILNHKRAGQKLSVITTIRRSVQISKLVYVFYRPSSLRNVQNIVDLCSNNNSKVPPFRLNKVIPFDLLPQTAYVETILFFERESVRK